MGDCLVCDVVAGRVPVPGGTIHESGRWHVDHCIGPLGVGTLVVKPKRHVVHVWELDDAETAELGPLLRRTAAVVAELARPAQVYVCLWSHAGGETGTEAGHIHFVVQPVSETQRRELGGGPSVQVAMFGANVPPPPAGMEAFAAAARSAFGDGP